MLLLRYIDVQDQIYVLSCLHPLLESLSIATVCKWIDDVTLYTIHDTLYTVHYKLYTIHYSFCRITVERLLQCILNVMIY